MNKLFAFFSAILFSVNAMADFTVDGVIYAFTNNGTMVYIKGYNVATFYRTNGIYSIAPSVTYEGTTYYVSHIGTGAFKNSKSIQAVTYDKTATYLMTRINSEAFFNCPVKTVELPEGITHINNKAFKKCSSLTNVKLPSSLTNIGESAFNSCANLSTLRNSSTASNVTAIGDSAFYNDTNVSDKALFSKVETIGKYAFYNCNSMTTLTLPATLKTLGVKSLTSVTTLTINSPSIVENSYASNEHPICEALQAVKKIIIGDNVTKIGVRAFDKAETDSPISLELFDTGNGVTTISSSSIYAFSKITTLKIGSSVNEFGMARIYYKNPGVDLFQICHIDNVEINSKVFAGQQFNKSNNLYSMFGANLASVTFGSNVTSLGRSILSNALGYAGVSKGSLTVTLPEALTTIGDSAFYNCSNVSAISLPSSVTSIGAHAFCSCENLSSVTLPKNLTQIGDRAFYDSGLTSVNAQCKNVPTAYSASFNHKSGITLTLTHCTYVDKYKAKTEWQGFGKYVGPHSTVQQNAKQATCTTDGHIAGYYCLLCKNPFSDAGGTSVISQEDWIVDATGHKWGDYIFNNDASSTSDGTETASCQNGCGATDTRDVVKTAIDVHSSNSKSVNRKYFENGMLIIEVNGEKYDILGRKIK